MTQQSHPHEPPPAGDELLTISEVAAIVRVPIATLRYWRHLGTGPHRLPHRPRRALLAQRSHHLAAKPKRRLPRRMSPHQVSGWENSTRGNVTTGT
jgi:hypothetical protein